MLNSVRLNDVDLYQKYNCILAHLEIGVPSVQSKFIAVPLRNGSLDFTEFLTDDVKYGDRPVNFKLIYAGKDIVRVCSDLQNLMHGKRCIAVFDEDASYYYEGRFEVDGYEVTKYGGRITISGTCTPFKYSVVSSVEDWLWDDFDFEEGYINELKNIAVNGTKKVTLIADAKGYAKITTTAQMTVEYQNTSVVIPVGTTTMYDFEFTEGENVLNFSGNGTISIDYRGGRL